MAVTPKVVCHAELAAAAPYATALPTLPPADDDADGVGSAVDTLANISSSSDGTDPCGPTLGLTREGYLAIDLPILLRTRLLVTASSGGGKSYAVRRILEQTAPLVQQIIIDPEGEFDTLAEKFPYAVFNNRDSKIPVSECSAYALAQEVMKKGVSAVIDISEFETEERHHFVARFIRGLMKLPKDHWHHVMVFLDESHIFAPQQDKSEAKKAVIDLACRGRKRGYCVMMATNRLSLLNKSVASELQNRLIGQTGLDTDLKRAADELGMGRLQTIATLTNLDPGNFMVYGPALSRTVQRVAIGPVQTTHGVRLGEIKGPTAPTDSLMDEIFGNVEDKDEARAADAAEERSDALAAEKAAKRDGIRTQVAEQRLRILMPIIASPEGTAERGNAITHASAQTGLNRQTIYNWLSRYDPANPIGSLAPARVPRNWSPMTVEPVQASAPTVKAPPRKRRAQAKAAPKSPKKKVADEAKPARAPRKAIIRLKAAGGLQ